MLGALLEVEMLKKRTALQREAHFEVKILKKPPFLEHYWKLRCAKSARRYAVVARSTFRTTFGR